MPSRVQAAEEEVAEPAAGGAVRPGEDLPETGAGSASRRWISRDIPGACRAILFVLDEAFCEYCHR